ncbi:MAG TPA: DUF2892 domain-containing protein [Puia sp.]
MKKNLGSADRVIRILLAIVLGYLYYSNIVSGTPGIVLGIVAIVLLLTSFISFCPLYAMFGFKSNKNREAKI